MIDIPPHQEMHPDGTPQGRDPRKMSADDLAAIGLVRISRGDAVRAKCLDCCGESPAEVRRCGAVDCALWPFRMGTDPFRAPMSEERRAEASERFKAMHAEKVQ